MNSNKFHSYIALLAVIQGFVMATVSPLPFNKKLSQSELERIEKGEVVIRNTGSIKNICIDSNDVNVSRALDVIRKLDPSYLAEVIQVRSVTSNENILKNLKTILLDIPSYVGIPYWSERHQRYFDLYSSGTVVSRQEDGATTHIGAKLSMSPFGDIHTDILLQESDGMLFYRSTNLNDLYYDGIKCVKEQNMKSVIMVFKTDDKWILYGIGGVEAPKIFFLKNRIEVSFMNRIKTFCNFVFSKL